MRKLLILSQIGSPSEPTEIAVNSYLKKFLMDPRIINIPFLIRWAIVNLIIVPKRKFSTAKKYKKIWTQLGSPLVVETNKFANKVSIELNNAKRKPNETWDVIIHWRYGNNNDRVLADINKNAYDEVFIAPLYPQYAEATTESALDVLIPYAKKFKNSKLFKLKPFYSTNEWTNSWCKIISPVWNKYEHIIFSFHGLPVSQVKKISGCQLNNNCCLRDNISKCYPAQCSKSVKYITEKLGIPRERFTVTYQSRVGPNKWLSPNTEKKATELASRGVKSLLVICPSFVTDGLETLEEVNIELRNIFINSGGEKFYLAESLNDSADWITGFKDIVLNENSWSPL